MSSHGQDRLETGAPDSLSSVPTQRQGKAQRSGATPTSRTGRHAAPRGPRVSRATVAKAATAAATGVRAATSATKRSTTVARATVAGTGPAKAASTKAGTTKAVGTKAATSAKAAAANAARAKAAPATKAASAKATTATAAPTAAPGVKSSARTSVTASGRTQRPTPYKRVAPEVVAPGALASVALAPEVLAAEVATPELEAANVVAPEVLAAEAATPELEAVEVVAAVAAGHRRALLRRRPPSLRQRPALYLAAALVGALSVSTFAAGPSDANAVAPAGHSVSIADKLGVKGQSDTVTPADATHLVELAASRNQRGADQAAAARAQATANRKAVAAKAAARPQAVDPVAGARLTSTFGMRWGVLHAGIDLAAPIGTPEYAAMDGVVLRAGPASGFGLAVYIQHANGDVTVYGHMEKILVQEGQVVRAGDTIALLGAMGQATGPHLHFEVHVGGMMGPKIDPIPWLQARGVSLIPAH